MISRVETFAISRIFRSFAKVYTHEIIVFRSFAKVYTGEIFWNFWKIKTKAFKGKYFGQKRPPRGGGKNSPGQNPGKKFSCRLKKIFQKKKSEIRFQLKLHRLTNKHDIPFGKLSIPGKGRNKTTGKTFPVHQQTNKLTSKPDLPSGLSYISLIHYFLQPWWRISVENWSK